MYDFKTNGFSSLDLIIIERCDSFSLKLLLNMTKKALRTSSPRKLGKTWCVQVRDIGDERDGGDERDDEEEEDSIDDLHIFSCKFLCFL